MKKLALSVMSVLVFLSFFFYLSKAAVQLTPPSQVIPQSYFGNHFKVGTPWPSVPVGAWRLWDTSTRWPDLEPSKGRWNFNDLDKATNLAQQHGTSVLLTLATTPQWASAHPDLKSGWQQPGLTSEPSSMDDWRAFVTQVATRYKGRINAYEIWNEPNLKQYWMGSTDQLIALTRTAHDAIKAVDPDALVVSPAATTSGGVGWLDEFLSKGGGQYVDVIGYHFYVHPQPPESAADLAQKVKQIMQKNGVGNKPVWCTEIGWSEPKPFPSDELAAAYVARTYVVSWAAGVARVFWYAWDNHKWASLQTTQADNQTLTPAGQADGVVQQWLEGARMDWCKSDDGNWSCQLEKGGVKQWIVWNPSGSKNFSVPSSWHAVTATPLLGSPQPVSGSRVQIGMSPILLTASGG
jgi:hypothetical protein